MMCEQLIIVIYMFCAVLLTMEIDVMSMSPYKLNTFLESKHSDHHQSKRNQLP